MSDKTTLDPNYGHYYRTVLEFHIEDQRLCVPLDRPVDTGTAYDLNCYCPGPGFVVITAFNPRGISINEDQNEARQEQLEVRMMDQRIPYLRCDGLDPDSDHRERGIAVHMDRPTAHDLGVEFEQSAMYWFDGSRFWLVPVLARGRRSEILPKGQKTHSGTTTIKI